MEREKFKTHQFSVSHHFLCNVRHLGLYLRIQPVYLVSPHPPTSLKFPFNQSLRNKSLPQLFIICPNFFAVPAIIEEFMIIFEYMHNTFTLIHR